MSIPQSVANELARQVANDVNATVEQPHEVDEDNGSVYTVIRTRFNTSSAYGCSMRFMKPGEKRSVKDELRRIVPDD